VISELQENTYNRTTSRCGKYSVSSTPSKCPTGRKAMSPLRKLDRRFISLLNGTAILRPESKISPRGVSTSMVSKLLIN